MEYSHLSQFCHKFGNLLESGIDAQRGLLMLTDEEKGAMRTAIARTYNEMKNAKSLSEAMLTDKDIYTEELVNAVSMAEMTGCLPQVFDRMSKYFDKKEIARKRLIQVSIYPAILLVVVMLSLLAVAYAFHFTGTAFTIIGETIAFFAVIIILCIVGKKLAKNSVFVGNILAHIPRLGKMLMRSEYADIADNLAMFYFSGVQLDTALEYCAKAVRHEVLRDKLLKAAGCMRGGKTLSEALSMQDIFPLEMINQIRVGERSGDMDKMLRIIAEYYREDEKLTMDMVSALIR